MEIRIDCTDWEAEFEEEATDVSSKDAMIATQQSRNYHQARMGRLYLVAREIGKADPDMMPPNKSLLNVAAATRWLQILVGETVDLVMPNGSVRSARAFALPVRSSPESEPGAEDPLDELPDETVLIDVTDPEGMDRAYDYLLKRVPGYIMGRLEIIAQDEERLKSAVEALHDKIDELYSRLVNGG